MVTGIEYRRHIYKVGKSLKSYTIYELETVQNVASGILTLSDALLPQAVRIELYRNKGNSYGITECLRGRNDKRWAKNASDGLFTGLRPMQFGNESRTVFRADDNSGNKSLLLVQVLEDIDTLVIDYFRGFYPFNPQVLKDLMNIHRFNL